MSKEITQHPHVHQYEFNRHCGANVCTELRITEEGAYDCDDHEGFVRCYCGWAADGGDGRDQLRDMGENLDDF